MVQALYVHELNHGVFPVTTLSCLLCLHSRPIKSYKSILLLWVFYIHVIKCLSFLRRHGPRASPPFDVAVTYTFPDK